MSRSKPKPEVTPEVPNEVDQAIDQAIDQPIPYKIVSQKAAFQQFIRNTNPFIRLQDAVTRTNEVTELMCCLHAEKEGIFPGAMLDLTEERHQARHQAAKQWLAEDVSQAEVARRLGHKWAVAR